jgi:hypothetical protein
MSIMYRKMLARKVADGKDTTFKIHGQSVDLKKIHRYVKRVSLSPSKFPSKGKVPPCVFLSSTPNS